MSNLAEFHIHSMNYEYLRYISKELCKRFILGQPAIISNVLILFGPPQEIERIKLFYEGMLFHQRTLEELENLV